MSLFFALGLIAAPLADDRTTLDRMVQCMAYHEQWQWDLRHAGQKVYRDSEWFVPFHQRFIAIAEALKIDRDDLARRNNRLVDAMREGLTAEQLADWKKCQAEFGWKPNANGETIDF